MAFILLPGITNIPLWAKSGTTIGDLLSRAVQLQEKTQDAPSLTHILDDPDYQPLLNQEVFQSGLLDGNLLNVFNPARSVLLIISFENRVYRFRMRAGATVRDAKQQIKKQLISDSRKTSAFELRITGSFDKPEGKTKLLTLTRLPYQNVCFDVVPKLPSQTRTPDLPSVNESVFRRHLQQSRFQAGVDQGLWRLVSINWPNAVMAVSAPGDYTAEHFVRFRLDGYPAQPPHVEPWDEEERLVILYDRWPDWFNHFIAESYPDLVTVDPPPYSTGLLELSVSIAARKRQLSCDSWRASGDLTQCLAPMINHLLSQAHRKGFDVRRRGVRRLVPQQQSA